MGRNHALIEDDAALGVDPGGDVRGRDLARRGAQFGGVLRLGQRMQVDDAEDALVIVLQRDPVADRTEVIAEMQVAGWLDAGEDAVHRSSNALRWPRCYRRSKAPVKPVAGAVVR